VRQVGRYLIQQLLGRGGMATVYRAHDPSIGRDVAIKFLHASLCEDEECRTRFLREARAAGGLSHANIVIVHDVGEIEGRPFMAMELIDGTPLDDVLEKRRQLPVRDVVLIGLQLARALEYAHARGIVHRDIKPGNIMLLKDGQSIKVTDFGIAHMDDGLKHRTQVGAVIGTPHYMSPEQARGEKLDGRSDLFAAGIVLYEMLTGERPFRGDNLVAVVNQIATAVPPSVNAKRPDAPAALRRVIERCLAKAPAERYPSGQELSAALRKVLDEIDETAKEKDKPRIVPLRVKWALMMAAIVAVVMGLTAAVITQRQYAALMSQASDYGAALARFIAAQNAAAVLGEDWVAVDVAIQEVMKTRNFERIVVIDNGGVVRSATVGSLVGQPYRAMAGESRGMLAGGVASSRYAGADGEVLGFEAPITYLDKQVGRIALGIPEQPLSQVARLSITLMIVLAVVTVLAVAVAMYFVANWFARPIRLVAESMAEIGKGRFSHRIGEARKDEFGQLFMAFDEMAQALQRREGVGSGAAATTTTTPPPGSGPA
jgi:serine/threonine-protein kinase